MGNSFDNPNHVEKAGEFASDLLSKPNLECYTSKVESLKFLFIFILMIGVFYYGTTASEIMPRIVGWFGIIFFGFFILFTTFRLLRSNIQVLVDFEGITDYRTKIGTIRWNEIKKIWIGTVEKERFLCIEVANPEIYLSNLTYLQRRNAKINASIGLSPITLSFTMLNRSLDDVVSFIKAKHPEKFAAE